MPTSAWVALALLFLLNVINFIDRTVIAVLIEPIARDLSLTDKQIGLLSLGFACAYAISALPLASFADRRSRPIILSACLALWSAMTAVCGFAHSFALLFAARFGVGLAESGCMPAAHSLIGDHFPHGRRAFALSLFTAGGSIGALLGFSLAGILYVQIGWRHTFLAVGIPGIILAIALAIFLKEPASRIRKVEPDEHGALAATLKFLAADRVYVLLVIGNIFPNFTTMGLSQWLVIFFHRSHDLPVSTTGPIFGIAFGFGMALGSVLGGFFGDRLSRRSLAHPLIVSIVSAVLVPFLCLAVLWLPNAYWALGLTFFAMTAAAAYSAPLLSTIQAICPSHRRSVASAVLMLSGTVLGAGMAPFIVGLLSDALRPEFGGESVRYALTMCVFACFLAAWFFSVARRRLLLEKEKEAL